mgnify:CR=1 FL=1
MAMSFLRWFESWAEALLRIVIGIGLAWIGVVEGEGYGLFLDVIGAIFIAAGIAEIWFVEVAIHGLPRQATMGDIHPALVTCDVPVLLCDDGRSDQADCRAPRSDRSGQRIHKPRDRCREL